MLNLSTFKDSLSSSFVVSLFVIRVSQVYVQGD